MFSAFYTMSTVQVSQSQGSYTLTETETDIDKIVTGTNGISVSVQYEHFQNSMQDIICRYRFWSPSVWAHRKSNYHNNYYMVFY